MDDRKSNIQVLILVFSLCLAITACSGRLPDTSSEEYRQAVNDYYLSLAAGETDEMLFAYNKMSSVANQYPREAAARANLGVYAMRQGNSELAADHFAQARQLAPGHSDILYLSGLFESREGALQQAIEYYREAVSTEPENLKFRYALVTELERQDDSGNAEEILSNLQQLIASAPQNLALLYELSRVSAKEQHSAQLNDYLNEMSSYTDAWQDNLREQLQHIQSLATEQAYQDVLLELAFLRTALGELSSFQEDLSSIQSDPTQVGYLITEFIWLPRPDSRAAAPNSAMRFTVVTPDSFPARAILLGSAVLDQESFTVAALLSGNQLIIDESTSLDFPSGVGNSRLSPHALAEIDFNYDFLNDYLMAGSGGLVLMRQNSDRTFTDVSMSLGLSTERLNSTWSGVWRADLDLDGDLDIILSPDMSDSEIIDPKISESETPSSGNMGPENPVPEQQTPVFLQNNGDDSFSPIELFTDEHSLIDFMMADLNADGAPDALFLRSDGSLRLYRNLRSGQWVREENLPLSSDIMAITVADINADSQLDLLVATADASVHRISFTQSTGEWSAESLTEAGSLSLSSSESTNPESIGPESIGSASIEAASFGPASTSLFTSDLDSNGRLDLIISSGEESRIWLGNDSGAMLPLKQELPGRIYTMFDADGNERMDLLGIRSDLTPFLLLNNGTRPYGTLSLRALASGTEGDRRINSFGIGSEMEIRSGLLYQKQLVTSPIVHFGLGEYQQAEMLRTVWPNGSVQADFAELGMGSTIFNEQILKGSCPWLFSFDGESMQFVTDILWRSPLGLRINAVETAGVAQTLDRVKIAPELLQPRDGLYDLRITAELWETHFFDHTSLLAVDHPEGTDIFIDERFAFPVPDLSTRLMEAPQPVASVLDHNGNDVSAQVRELDQTYLRTFNKTEYQGLTEEHFIEINLGSEAPTDGPLWLIASGWLHPTDSSINLALSQGSIASPTGLRIEVSSGDGDWATIHPDYGFPAGKHKNILLDLESVFPDPTDRRIRLHTTSEIYWDAIRWAKGLPRSQVQETQLTPVKTELRYHGYSQWNKVGENAPLLPDYTTVSGTAARWRNLAGYHTRFGDVSELTQAIDDRYVIMNSGDELVLQFEAPDAPPAGWTRSFVFISDGWEKDGDYNTGASRTVVPLPFHGQQEYLSGAENTLLNDPVYQRYKEDWATYHTRYITPESFQYAVTPER